MIELAVLAGSVVSSVLVPMAKSGIEKLAESAAEQFGQAAAGGVTSVASRVWDRVRELFATPAEKGALESFKEFPDAGAPILRAILEKKLRDDQQLAQELDRLMATEVSQGQPFMQAINAVEANVLNVQGSQISGGVVAAKVVQAAPTESGTLGKQI